MRTTVELDDSIAQALREIATRKGKTFRSVLNETLRRGIRAPSAGSKSKYVCPVHHMGAPRAGVDLDKALATASSLEEQEVGRELDMRK